MKIVGALKKKTRDIYHIPFSCSLHVWAWTSGRFLKRFSALDVLIAVPFLKNLNEKDTIARFTQRQ